MKTLAVIPARAGSKGLPGKNLMEIQGKSTEELLGRSNDIWQQIIDKANTELSK